MDHIDDVLRMTNRVHFAGSVEKGFSTPRQLRLYHAATLVMASHGSSGVPLRTTHPYTARRAACTAITIVRPQESSGPFGDVNLLEFDVRIPDSKRS